MTKADMKKINQNGYTIPAIVWVLVIILIGIGGYFFSKNNSSKPTTIQTPTANSQSETSNPDLIGANWETYTSMQCGISVKHPKEWTAQDTVLVAGTNDPDFDYGCFSVNAPDFKDNGERYSGFKIEIKRTSLGIVHQSVTINSIDSYIKAELPEPTNITDKTYGSLIGKYFVVNGQYSNANFAAIKGNFIYTVTWRLDSNSSYVSNIDQIISTFKFTDQIFKSDKGSFEIALPSDMKMIEGPERIQGGVTMGEVWFTFGQFDEKAPSGLVVVYGKPAIDGKGGACFDEKTGAGYTKEMISGQKVQTCQVNGFSASYFTNPTKKIEYSISTSRLSLEQLKVVSEAVRKTLRFE